MKKQLCEEKKQGRIRVLAVLAAAAAICTIAFDYIGISGNIESLQGESWMIAPWGVVSVPPRWFLLGCLFGTLLALCCYAIYCIKTQQKRYGRLLLWLFFAFWVNMLCLPGSEILVYMTAVVGGLFAFANVPPAIGKAITQKLALQNPEKQVSPEFIRQQLWRMEWVDLFPLKRILVACAWLACPIIAMIGMIAHHKAATGGMGVVLLLLVAAALTARKAWDYVTTPCHCVPILNKVFSKQEIEHLLRTEVFELYPFENKTLQEYVPILISDNWVFAEGLLVSRKLLISAAVCSIGISGRISQQKSRIEFLYLDGNRFVTHKAAIHLKRAQYSEIKQVLKHCCKAPTSGTTKSTEEMFNAILHEIEDRKEKLWYLLTHDTSDFSV